jgi:hypothetical protein
MFFRVFVSLGLLALGYYVGREIGRAEPIRKDLKNLRDDEIRKVAASQTQAPRPPADSPKR